LKDASPFLERMHFEWHLGMCQDCRAYLRQMRATIDAIGNLPGESIPPQMSQKLLDRFRSWKR